MPACSERQLDAYLNEGMDEVIADHEMAGLNFSSSE